MKTCDYEGCNNPVFGGGYCLYHQWCRKKGKGNPSRKSTSQLSTTSKSLLKVSWGFSSQVELFTHIWDTRPHTCLFTGLPLDGSASCFLHILRKGKYTFYKFNPFNIVLGHPDFHYCVDNWDEKYRDKYPTWDFDSFFKMQDDMKIRYRAFEKEHML